MPTKEELNLAIANIQDNINLDVSSQPLALLGLLTLIADKSSTGGTSTGTGGTVGGALETTLQQVRNRLPAALNTEGRFLIDTELDTVLLEIRNRLPASLTGDGRLLIDTELDIFIQDILSRLPQLTLNGTRLAVDSIVKTANTNPGQINAFATLASGLIKNTSGAIYAISAINQNTAIRYLQLFNKATAPAANDVPMEVFIVYPNGGQLVLGQDYFTINGLDFAAGIGWGMSTTSTIFTPATATETFFTARFL